MTKCEFKQPVIRAEEFETFVTLSAANEALRMQIVSLVLSIAILRENSDKQIRAHQTTSRPKAAT